MVRIVVMLAGVLSLVAACTSGGEVHVLNGIALAPGQTPTTGTSTRFELTGAGGCYVDVDWGDGDIDTQTPTNLSGPVTDRTISHVYSGWRGGKTVTVTGARSCAGQERLRFVTTPPALTIAFAQPGPMACQAMPNRPLLRTGNIFRLTATPARGSERGIDFGCFAGGCVYDLDGKPGSSAVAPFPFVGLREYSLVVRNGSQIVQGGMNMQFTATEDAVPDICINDNTTTNNRGGYELDIRVDQLGPGP
jgi:hypothetical protein